MPPSPPIHPLEARLALLSIPDPLEDPVGQQPLAPASLVPLQAEATLDQWWETDAWIPWEESPLLTSSRDGEKEIESSAEPRIPQTAKNESESEKAGSFEKMPSLPLPKPVRAASRYPRNEQIQEKLPESMSAEVPHSFQPYEATAFFHDISNKVDGPISDSSLSGKGTAESSIPELKPSALNPAVGLFPSLLNDKVQDFISFFQGRAESFFSRSLARSQAYEEMMKRIFREKNLPEELFYLALIESGYNPTALSRAKASGIWQFIGQTAKRFGLRVDKWVDERRDPEKSTLAAAEYLKTLHGMFNNWDLATASYNAGEAKVLNRHEEGPKR